MPALLDWSLWDSLVLLLIAGSIAAAIAWLWSSALRFLWSSGMDTSHRMAHTVAPIRLMLLISVTGITLSPLHLDATPGGISFLLACLLLVTIIALKPLRDVVAGVLLAVRRPFTIGDQVEVGTVTGRVIDLGLTRVHLITPQGDLVSVPTRALGDERIRTGPLTRQTLPISVSVTLDGQHDMVHVLAEMRDHVYLSCYLDASAPVIVEVTDRDTLCVHATPIHPDDRDELRSDIITRALRITPDGPS